MKHSIAKLLAMLVGLAVLCVLGLAGFVFATAKDDSVYSGEAYGFVIGQTHSEAFERAVRLKASGELAEIRRWPEGSGPIELAEADLASASQDARWSMVVDPDWWNNSIRLEFRNGRLRSWCATNDIELED
jgi:hypothetical protein